jgi:CRISPR-associated protein Cas1
MATLYINQNDCLLKKVDERLVVIKDKEKLMDVQLIKITQVVIFGRVTVTHEVFSELSARNISLSYLSEHGKYKTRLEPPLSKNVILRIAQYKNNLDEELKCKLAKEFVKGKLMNYRMAILQLQRENDRRSGKEMDFSSSINLLKEMIKKADAATDADKIRGYEGCGSAEYFKCFPKFIKNPDFKFLKRERHPPPDSVNALLSLGYSLLRMDLEAAINIVGFDPYIGYLHSDRYGRASLALDLMEEFRPLVVDSCIIQMVNRKQLTPDDFSEDFPGSVLLKDEARKKFFNCYTQRKQTEFRHPYFNTKADYLRCFELQARILAKYLTGEIDQYIPLVMR